MLRIALLGAVSVALLTRLMSIEIGIIVGLCAVLWCCHQDQDQDAPPSSRPGCPAGRPHSSSSSPDRPNTRMARKSTNVRRSAGEGRASSSSEPGTASAGCVPNAAMQRTPLAPLVPEHPEEHLLDAALLRQTQSRGRDGVRLDHTYHTRALPAAIAAAARDLTTCDPAIVPIAPETRYRSLGEV